MSNASFLSNPSWLKNNIFLLPDSPNIVHLIDLENCPANLIWPSFVITTVNLAMIPSRRGIQPYCGLDRSLERFIISCVF
jgi:hypothetical protein